jgi:hypothetical protein
MLNCPVQKGMVEDFIRVATFTLSGLLIVELLSPDQVGVSLLILGLGFCLGWWLILFFYKSLILWLQQEFVAEVMNICSSDLCEMCRENILDGAMEMCLRALVAIVCCLQ